MKAIIYSGIVLFSAASVYGLTDFYKSSNNGSLKNLYQETEPQETVYRMAPLVKLITAANNPHLVKNTSAKDKEELLTEEKLLKNIALKPERKIYLEDFSRGRIIPRQRNLDNISKEDTAVIVQDVVPVVMTGTDS